MFCAFVFAQLVGFGAFIEILLLEHDPVRPRGNIGGSFKPQALVYCREEPKASRRNRHAYTVCFTRAIGWGRVDLAWLWEDRESSRGSRGLKLSVGE